MTTPVGGVAVPNDGLDARQDNEEVEVSSRQGPGKWKLRAALWLWAFAIFYLFFTPACGVMYSCGCRLALSKSGQVETCNIFDHSPGVHKCPWCSCSGIACIFVAYDTKTFRGVFLLDLLPDGFFVTIFTVIFLYFTWRAVDMAATRYKLPLATVLVSQALLALVWFVAFCLIMGSIFFLADSDYPYFLGFEREKPSLPGGSGQQGLSAAPIAGRFLVNASALFNLLQNLTGTPPIILDARDEGVARVGALPGATVVPWTSLAQGGPVQQRAVPRPADELASQLSSVGGDGTRPIVVYGSWDQGWGEEGRLFWTLDYLGLSASGLFCLDGGVEAWRQAGYPLGSPAAVLSAAPGCGTPRNCSGQQPQVAEVRIATTEDVQQLYSSGLVLFLDVREHTEYVGSISGDPYGAARSGHIPTAEWWQWRDGVFMPQAVGSTGPPKLRSCTDIVARLPLQAAAAKELVVYCTGGVRSGFVFMILRGCGFGSSAQLPALRNYGGSWWAWAGDSRLPCEGAGSGCVNQQPQQPGGGGSSGGSGRLL